MATLSAEYEQIIFKSAQRGLLSDKKQAQADCCESCEHLMHEKVTQSINYGDNRVTSTHCFSAGVMLLLTSISCRSLSSWLSVPVA